MHTPAPPFAHTLGPRNAKIALVGESWGEAEEKTKVPFVGYSGQELTRMLTDAGIQRSECFLTNVLALRPQDNNLDHLCGSKAEVGGPAYPLPPIKIGKYLRPEYLSEITRLREELSIVRPNITVALGNVACWALLGTTGISSLRGTTSASDLIPGLKTIPTYHPAGVLRNWAWRPIVLADLMKAKREAEFPEIRRPKREILYLPSLEEMDSWIARHEYAPELTIDVETTKGQIDMIGFADGPSHAMVVPFFYVEYGTGTNVKALHNFWPTAQEESKARKRVQRLLLSPAKKITQNGLYDYQYILKEGFKIRNAAHDTMLLHHSLFPEMQKGLGFLGSIYTSESSWKLLNKNKGEALKRDD